MRSTKDPLNAIKTGHAGINYEKLESDPKDCLRHRSDREAVPRNVKLRPEQMPDPWLFDSEKLLRELDRCREMLLLVPISTAEHKNRFFELNIAIAALWNLREQIRYLLSLHREGQRAFAQKAQPLTDQPKHPFADTKTFRHERPSRA